MVMTSRARFLRIMLYIAIIAVTIPLGYTGYMAWRIYELVANFCGTTVHRTIPSPDLQRVAIIFDVNCGATTDFDTQISIVDVGETFSPERTPSSVAVRGQYDLDPHWVSDRLLDVVLPRNERIYLKDAHAGDVEIRYRSHFVVRNWVGSPDQQLREWNKAPPSGR